MEGIQLENGYTKIANQLLEKFAQIKISGTSWRILITIIRKLYGYNKKEDWIAYSQIQKITKLPKSRISESIKQLREYGIVTQKRNSGTKYSIGINKNFLITQKRTVTEKRNAGVTESRTTKETITKENTKVSAKADPPMKIINENQHSDQWESVIDIDTGKPIQKILKEVNPSIANAMWTLITWSVQNKRSGMLYPNLGKQFKALKMLRSMGVEPHQIQTRWAELEEEDFYKKTGIDFMTLVKSFEKRV